MENNLFKYIVFLSLIYMILKSCYNQYNTLSESSETNNEVITPVEYPIVSTTSLDNVKIEPTTYQSNSVVSNKLKENFSFQACENIYGINNPRCNSNKNLNHIGYYDSKNTKFPILKFENDDKNRFIMDGKKIVPFNQKYWDKVFYFDEPFKYRDDVPYSFVYNFYFIGKLSNVHINKTYYLFEKKVEYNLYKYILFQKINESFVYSFGLPFRTKINLGDVVFIKNNSSTLGPFIFN